MTGISSISSLAAELATPAKRVELEIPRSPLGRNSHPLSLGVELECIVSFLWGEHWLSTWYDHREFVPKALLQEQCRQ